MVTAERLRELLDCDPETGVLTWRVSRRGRVKPGQVAGKSHHTGYHVIRVDGRQYPAHRLVWLHVTGAWPAAEVDHINGVRNDNRFSNLRDATSSQNGCNARLYRNNKSGLKGAILNRPGRWIAQIQKGGRKIYLGVFDTPEEAHAAYCAAAERLHGDFARTA
jgi:hypothetical protein